MEHKKGQKRLMDSPKAGVDSPKAGGYFLRKCFIRLISVGLTTFFLWGISTGAASENYSLTYRDKPFDLQFIDDNHGWIVGDQGLILSTKNGGVSWVKHKRKSIDPLFGVDFVDSKTGWIVGKKGLILHTNTGGEHWENQKSGTDSDLMAVKFLDEKKGVAVGSFGTILRTTDRGASWQVYPFDWENALKEVIEATGLASPHLYDIFFIGNCGYITGENGVILRTSDEGANWELVRGGILPPLFSICFKDCFIGWAVGQNGLALRSSDGKTWEKIEVPATENLLKIRIREDFSLIVGDYGTILISYDSGKTWERFSQTDEIPSVWLSDIYPIVGSNEKAVIIGKGVLKTIEFKTKRRR